MDTIESVVETLEEFCPGVDVASNEKLIDDRILTSLTMVALVAELEDELDVEIPPVEIVASNFNSAAAIASMTPASSRRTRTRPVGASSVISSQRCWDHI